MGKQIGLIQFSGSVGGITFYQTKTGNFARVKSSLDAERISKDPAFERSREQSKEFGLASKAGHLLRKTLHPLLYDVADRWTASKFTRLMLEVKAQDLVSPRGERTVENGILTEHGRALFRGLNFKSNSSLDRVLFKVPELDLESGNIALPSFSVTHDLSTPKNASHVQFTSAMVCLDFGKARSELILSEPITLDLKVPQTNLLLEPSSSPEITGTKLYLLKIAFLQLVNGSLYPIQDGRYHVVEVIG